MFLAIDRVSKFTFVEFYEKAGKMNAAAGVLRIWPPTPVPSGPGTNEATKVSMARPAR